jgi:hypothetical protein
LQRAVDENLVGDFHFVGPEGFAPIAVNVASALVN